MIAKQMLEFMLKDQQLKFNIWLRIKTNLKHTTKLKTFDRHYATQAVIT